MTNKRYHEDDYAHPNNYYRKLHASARRKHNHNRANRRVRQPQEDTQESSQTGLTQFRSPSTPSFWDQARPVLERGVAQVAGATLGFIGGNVPGASVGFVDAGKLYDFTHQMDLDGDAYDNLQPKKDISMGKYLGKFPRAKKNKINSNDRGRTLKRETYGRIDDPQSVYIGHSTWDHSIFAEVLTGTLVRKLFHKAAIPVNDRYSILPLAQNGSGLGFKIDFTIYNCTTGVSLTETTYSTVPADTITTVIAGLAAMQTWIRLQLLNSDDPNQERPLNLCLYQNDTGGGGDPWRLVAKLDLSNEYVKLFVASTLTIQNRTSGDNATVTDKYQIDRIDNQPLKGKIYEFYNGDPQLRVPSVTQQQINWAPQDGAFLVRGAQLPAEFQDIPPKNYRKNVSKSVSIKLPVGGIKKTTIMKVHKGKFVDMINHLRCITYTNNATVNYAMQCPGKCQLLGFEEELRTAGTNHVTLQYQRQLIVGAVSNTLRPAPIMPGLVTNARDNLTV